LVYPRREAPPAISTGQKKGAPKSARLLFSDRPEGGSPRVAEHSAVWLKRKLQRKLAKAPLVVATVIGWSSKSAHLSFDGYPRPPGNCAASAMNPFK
jgi:hypothetical protein